MLLRYKNLCHIHKLSLEIQKLNLLTKVFIVSPSLLPFLPPSPIHSHNLAELVRSYSSDGIGVEHPIEETAILFIEEGVSTPSALQYPLFVIGACGRAEGNFTRQTGKQHNSEREDVNLRTYVTPFAQHLCGDIHRRSVEVSLESVGRPLGGEAPITEKHVASLVYKYVL